MKGDTQARQDAEYWFPYHYISKMSCDGFSQHVVDTWGINYISTIEFMLDKLCACNPRSVVDVGCGDGRFTREISKVFPSCNIVGLDYSRRAINLAKAMNQDIDQLEFRTIDIVNHKSNEKFDIAILMEVFEHIPLNQTNDFLKGVHSLLTSDGTLLLTVPHSNKPVEYKHFQHFTLQSIESQLSSYFNIEEVMPFEKRSFFRRLINSVLSNRFFVLNNRKILVYLYRFYKSCLFICQSEEECQRIFIKAIPKSL